MKQSTIFTRRIGFNSDREQSRGFTPRGHLVEIGGDQSEETIELFLIGFPLDDGADFRAPFISVIEKRLHMLLDSTKGRLQFEEPCEFDRGQMRVKRGESFALISGCHRDVQRRSARQEWIE